MASSDDPVVLDSRFESEVIRAARLAEQRGMGDLFQVSGKLFDAINAESDARAEFRRLGISWPTECKEFWPHAHSAHVMPQEPAAFVRERWGIGLLAVLRKRRSERFRVWDALDSPTVRRLLLILEEGLTRQRPEFEALARAVAKVILPPPRRGNRTKISLEEEEKRDHAAFLWHHFKAIFQWLDADLPEETDQEVLLRRLESERPYCPALKGLGALGGAEFLFEKEMLPFVARTLSENRLSDGQREASAIRKGFTKFCLHIGLALGPIAPAAFVTRIQKVIRGKPAKKKPEPVQGETKGS